MAKKNKIQYSFDSLTCGEIDNIVLSICFSHCTQMAKEVANALIMAHHADHIQQNKTVYNKLIKRIESRLLTCQSTRDNIAVDVCNAHYDITCKGGKGLYV